MLYTCPNLWCKAPLQASSKPPSALKASSPLDLEPPWSPLRPPFKLPWSPLQAFWRWSPLQAPIKPSEDEAPFNPLSSPLEAPLQRWRLQAPFKLPFSAEGFKPPSSPPSALKASSPLEAPFKPPSRPLEAPFKVKPLSSLLQAPLKPPWSALEAPFKPPWSLPKVKPPFVFSWLKVAPSRTYPSSYQQNKIVRFEKRIWLSRGEPSGRKHGSGFEQSTTALFLSQLLFSLHLPRLCWCQLVESRAGA